MSLSISPTLSCSIAFNRNFTIELHLWSRNKNDGFAHPQYLGELQSSGKHSAPQLDRAHPQHVPLVIPHALLASDLLWTFPFTRVVHSQHVNICCVPACVAWLSPPESSLASPCTIQSQISSPRSYWESFSCQLLPLGSRKKAFQGRGLEKDWLQLETLANSLRRPTQQLLDLPAQSCILKTL